MRGKRIAIAVAALSTITFVVPPVASADENGYLDYLRNNGYMLPLPPGQLIQGGYAICQQLRAGATPEEVVSRYNVGITYFPSFVVTGAQQQLCPDTIH